jgi:isopenicillin N synthase-like dioxygenase
MTTDEIPLLDVAALYGPPSPRRDATDRAIAAAAAEFGFMTISGLSDDLPIGAAARRELLRIFALPATEIRKLWRQKFHPTQTNVYRGWFPLQHGDPTYKEGIDLGPDVAYGQAAVRTDDILCEATPFPSERLLPGWRDAAAAYYRALEHTAALLMRSIARGLALPETSFDAAFKGGISTLRLIRYPQRNEAALAAAGDEIWVTHRGENRHLVGRAHADSGFVTLLAQNGIEGLQARARNGDWLDVPPQDDTLAVNFGKVLDRWTGGRIKATEHRVLGVDRERFFIPFFYEPRPDAVIAPLPIPGVEPFAPFLFGDHLWASTTKFVEYRGLEHLRQPRGVSQAALMDQHASPY